MTLREQRCAFTKALANLILFAYQNGYEVALDEVTERLTAKDPTSDHMKGSLHHLGLAADVLLYRDGVYLEKTEDYTILGKWWEQRGQETGLPLTWGGRFHDGNHFSLSRDGKK